MEESKQSAFERLRSSANLALWKAKAFYFVFYASVGSLEPYLALYYKHTLLLSPRQIGILLGIRPCCLLFSSPILGTLADKLNRFRAFLLVCLTAYLLTYTTVILVEPVEDFNCATKPESSTKEKLLNGTSVVVRMPNHTHHELNTRQTREINLEDLPRGLLLSDTNRYAPKFKVASNQKHEDEKKRVGAPVVAKGHYQGTLMGDLYFSWPFSLYDYKIAELFTWKLFIVLLFVTVVGELLASPANTFADLYTIQALEENSHKFGHQIIPGVIGGGAVGAILSLTHHSKVLESSGLCGKGFVLNGKPYFFSFFVLMGASIVIASFFKYRKADKTRNLIKGCNECTFFNTLYNLLKNGNYLTFLITVALCGLGDGMKSQFLHAYLSDLTGFKTIYPVALLIQFISQVVVLLFSHRLISKIGHQHLISIGLLFYAITFSTYSFAENGWIVLAVEPLDGFARKLTYVAFVTYVGSPPEVGASLQGVVHGIYIGLGNTVGGFLGALFILKYGYFAVFISLGIAYLVLFGLHLGILHYFDDGVTIGESFRGYRKVDDITEDVDDNSEYAMDEK